MYLTKSRISFFFFLGGSRFGIAGEGIFFFFFWKDRDLELPEKEFFFFLIVNVIQRTSQ